VATPSYITGFGHIFEAEKKDTDTVQAKCNTGKIVFFKFRKLSKMSKKTSSPLFLSTIVSFFFGRKFCLVIFTGNNRHH